MVEREKTRKEKKSFYLDEDFKIFKVLLKRITERYEINASEAMNMIQGEIMIPCTIFNDKLSPLETEVKYLKENLGLKYSKIAELLGRDRKSVWQAYKNAAEKMPEDLDSEDTEYNIPVSALRAELSILEATVVYMKEQFNLNYHKIAEIINRDERTIWTVYARAKRKFAS